jgi:hypothetical protein
MGQGVMMATSTPPKSTKKCRLGPEKWAKNFGTRKTVKKCKNGKNVCESVGRGGWPLISIEINPPSLGINGIHCIECPGEKAFVESESW